ncbi:hypothetical protein D3C81_1663690 [compost metagenome]
MFQLGFLEVRHDPYIIDRHDIEQGNARCDETTEANLTVTDHAIHRCVYHGVLEIDPGEITCGLCLAHSGHGSLALGYKHRDALLLRLDRCRSGRNRGRGSGLRGTGFIDQGLADRIADDQFAAAVVGLGRQAHVGGG